MTGPTSTAADAILSVRDLRVWYGTERGAVRAVDGVTFDVRPGRDARPGRRVRLRQVDAGPRTDRAAAPRGRRPAARCGSTGRNLIGIVRPRLRGLRGPRTRADLPGADDPPQPADADLRAISSRCSAPTRRGCPRTRCARRSLDALAAMGIPPTRFNQYPHEFSGGMRQRIMIALALVLRPKFLVADEPTTALDVLVEAQILGILADLRRNFDTALLLITHNLGIVAEACDRVAVMYAGRIVEKGDAREVFSRPGPPVHARAAGLDHLAVDHRAALHPGRPAGSRRPTPRLPLPPALPRTRMRVCATKATRSTLEIAGGHGAGVLAARPRRADRPVRTGTAGAGGDRRCRRSLRHGAGAAGARADAPRALARGPRPARCASRCAAASSPGWWVGRTGSVKAVDGVNFTLAPRRGARRGGRVRQRQDDARPGAARLWSRRPAASIMLDGRGHHRPVRARVPAAAAAAADRLPGSARLAQPGDGHRRPSVGHPLRIHGTRQGPRGDRRAGSGRRSSGSGFSPAERFIGQVPQRPLRRAEAAGRPRARDHPGAATSWSPTSRSRCST